MIVVEFEVEMEYRRSKAKNWSWIKQKYNSKIIFLIIKRPSISVISWYWIWFHTSYRLTEYSNIVFDQNLNLKVQFLGVYIANFTENLYYDIQSQTYLILNNFCKHVIVKMNLF